MEVGDALLKARMEASPEAETTSDTKAEVDPREGMDESSCCHHVEAAGPVDGEPLERDRDSDEAKEVEMDTDEDEQGHDEMKVVEELELERGDEWSPHKPSAAEVSGEALELGVEKRNDRHSQMRERPRHLEHEVEGSSDVCSEQRVQPIRLEQDLSARSSALRDPAVEKPPLPPRALPGGPPPPPSPCDAVLWPSVAVAPGLGPRGDDHRVSKVRTSVGSVGRRLVNIARSLSLRRAM